MKRTYLLFATIALALIGFGIYRAGEHELPPPNSNSQIVFNGGSATGRRIKMKSWSANYDRIVSNADQSMLVVDGVHDGVIDKKGKPYLRVDATHVTVNMISHDLEITGPLHVETIGQTPARSFDTDSGNWNDGLQILTLPKRVTVHTRDAGPLEFSSATINVKTGEVVANNPTGHLH